MVSDGWAASRSIPWNAELGCHYEWCVHSRKTNKGVNKPGKSSPAPKTGVRKLKKKNPTQSTESQMVAKQGLHKGKLVKRLWVNKKGFRSNNAESLFNQVKRWCRKRNGTLPCVSTMQLYLSSYMFAHNGRDDNWSERCIAASKVKSRDCPACQC